MIRLGAMVERLRSSLFFLPMIFVLLGAVAGQIMIGVDERVDAGARRDLPFVLTSTVDGAREVLAVVASATITVAGIAFSITLLVIQQASGQYSPRVVHSLFRDPFNRRVMGLVVGTFTFCLVVLRSVRGAGEDIDALVPSLSVSLSVLLGVAAILAIVAFIDHNAHSMEVSQILRRVTDETVTVIKGMWPDRGDDGSGGDGGSDATRPQADGTPVTFTGSGWLQQVSTEGMLGLVPPGGTIVLETSVGRYAVRGTPLCTVWPAPDDVGDLRDRASGAVALGAVRTMQQDPSYGVRQLADVALVALSPGVNDPTTAQDAIFHLTEAVHEAFLRDPPPVVVSDQGRRLVRGEGHTHETLLALAFDEIRRSAANQPAVCTYLLEALHLIRGSMLSEGLTDRADLVVQMARHVVDGTETGDLAEHDRRGVHAAFDRRFGGQGVGPRG